MADRFKQALRETCAHVRKNLSPDYQRNASKQICAQIRQLDRYRHAKKIALYQAVNGEIDLSNLWGTAPLHGKYCYFPALNDDQSLSFLPATPSTTFHKNRFEIDEPAIEREHALAPEQLDLIFIPLVAFDKQGTRLGMGGGYYDRTLAKSHSALLVGVAYDFQCQPFIEAQPWDIPLDLVITERRIYWIKDTLL